VVLGRLVEARRREGTILKRPWSEALAFLLRASGDGSMLDERLRTELTVAFKSLTPTERAALLRSSRRITAKNNFPRSPPQSRTRTSAILHLSVRTRECQRVAWSPEWIDEFFAQLMPPGIAASPRAPSKSSVPAEMGQRSSGSAFVRSAT